MTELAWTAIRSDTIDRFHGQTPRPEDETHIIDVFELHPQLVLRAIDETAAALDAGKITWAWSVLNARLARGTNAIREATADTKQSKLKAIERAKQWIHNAGIHYDLERHVEAELFGDEWGSGIISTPLTDDQRNDLIQHWRDQRPRGIQAEADSIAWQAECAGSREAVQAILARKKREREAANEPAAATADDDIAW